MHVGVTVCRFGVLICQFSVSPVPVVHVSFKVYVVNASRNSAKAMGAGQVVPILARTQGYG